MIKSWTPRWSGSVVSKLRWRISGRWRQTRSAERSGGDGILGSTAIFVAVDTALLLKRNDHDVRTLSSIQRYGLDLEPVTLVLD